MFEIIVMLSRVIALHLFRVHTLMIETGARVDEAAGALTVSDDHIFKSLLRVAGYSFHD